jgi:hypothetical membrane protein
MIGSLLTLMSITVAESLTPGYSISAYQISGLGSPIFRGICTSVSDCMAGPTSPIQPASAVFVSSIFVSSVLGFCYAYLLRRATTHRRFALAVGISMAGWFVVGVSYFPFYLGWTGETVVTGAFIMHLSGAYLNGVVGILAAIATWRFTRAPMRYITVTLVAVSAAGLILLFSGNYLGLGLGGMQRVGVYPMLLWSVAFGAYLTRGLD